METSIQIVAVVCIVAGAIAFLIFGQIQKQNNESSSRSRNSKSDDPTANTNSAEDEDIGNNTGWKCACEGGGIFLPPSLMKNLGGPGAALRLGTGSCYHKQM